MVFNMIKIMVGLAFLFVVFATPVTALELELGAATTITRDDDIFGGRSDLAVLRLSQKLTSDGRLSVFYQHISRFNQKDEGTDFVGLVVNVELWRFFK